MYEVMLQIITLILSKIESLISKSRDYYKTFGLLTIITIQHILYTSAPMPLCIYVYRSCVLRFVDIFGSSQLLARSSERGITHRPTTLLVTEIALPRLLMGKGMRGIHRGFIEETVILEKRWDLARLVCVKVQHSIAVQQNVSVATYSNIININTCNSIS